MVDLPLPDRPISAMVEPAEKKKWFRKRLCQNPSQGAAAGGGGGGGAETGEGNEETCCSRMCLVVCLWTVCAAASLEPCSKRSGQGRVPRPPLLACHSQAGMSIEKSCSTRTSGRVA